MLSSHVEPCILTGDRLPVLIIRFGEQLSKSDVRCMLSLMLFQKIEPSFPNQWGLAGEQIFSLKEQTSRDLFAVVDMGEVSLSG
jgi:hypothetical protein